MSHATRFTGSRIPLHTGLRNRVSLRHQCRLARRRDPIPTAFCETKSRVVSQPPVECVYPRFVEGQVRSALRYSLGPEWPLGSEFWADKVSPMRKVMDEFAEPLLNAALDRRDERLANGGGKERQDEATNLLDHLVDQTQGRLLEWLPE